MLSTRAIQKLAAALALILALGVGAPLDTVQQRQVEAVRTAVQDDPATQARETELIAAAARAAALLDLRLSPNGEGRTLVLRVQGAPIWDVRRLEEGSRLAIDLHGAISLLGEPKRTPSTPSLVRSVNTSFTIEDGAFLTRVEADLARPCAFSVREHGDTIEVDLQPSGRAFSEPRLPMETAADLEALALRRVRLLAAAKARIAERAARDIDAIQATSASDGLHAAVEALLDERSELHSTQLAAVTSYIDGTTEETEAIGARIAALAAAASDTTEPPRGFDREAGQVRAAIQSAIEADRAHLDAFEREGEVIRRAFAERIAALEADYARAEDARAFVDAQRRMREVLDNARALDVDEAPSAVDGPETGSVEATADLDTVSFEPLDLAALSPGLDAPLPLAATDDEPLALPMPDDASPEPTDRGDLTPGEAIAPDQEETPPDADDVETEDDLGPAETAPETPSSVQTISVAPAARRAAPRVNGGIDPLYEPVTIDFRDMDLSNVVAILAQKAQINVIAGNDVSVTGAVTAYLQDVPLLRAMETVLRMNDLGIVEEEGIYRIVPYREALAARRTSRIIHLQRAQATDVSVTLEAVAQGMPEGARVSVAVNEPTNTVVLSGPEERVAEIETLTHQLDVAESSLPTETVAIKLNYAEPEQVQPLIESMLTPEVGTVESDTRSRHLIITDQPMIIEQVQTLVEQVDKPVRQVAIEAMVIDAVLRDASQTGVNWLLDMVRSRDRLTGAATGILDGRRNTRGNVIGSLHDLNFGGNLGNIGSEALDAGVLTFGVLTSDFDLRGAIAAEVASRNAEILANPVSVTLENNEAQLEIVQEYPYQQITQSTQGPAVASTSFKDIGITLSVLPRVTHDNDIIVSVDVKQSSVSGITQDGIPIEDRRSATTELRTKDGRTIFIGGLRNVADRMDVSKIPVLGDLPVLSFMFRTTDIEKTHTELLIFLTCHVIQDLLPELTPEQQVEYDKLSDVPDVPDAQRAYFRSLVRPGEMRDPAWKWRRTP